MAAEGVFIHHGFSSREHMMNDNYDLDGAYGAFWEQMESEEYGEGFLSNLNIFGKKDDCSNRPYLAKGTSDSATTVELQGLLGVTADGIFGSGTERALQDFQSQNGLPSTGAADSSTWITLCTGKTPAQRMASQQATAAGVSAGAGFLSQLISPKKKGGRGPAPLATVIPEDEPTNWLLWVGLPLGLVVVGGGIYMMTRE